MEQNNGMYSLFANIAFFASGPSKLQVTLADELTFKTPFSLRGYISRLEA
jgi:hypothetical protein